MPDRKSISEFIVFEENHERVIFEIKDNRMVSFSVDHRLGHCVGDIIIGKVSGIVTVPVNSACDVTRVALWPSALTFIIYCVP